jgi:hypothetical protein
MPFMLQTFYSRILLCFICTMLYVQPASLSQCRNCVRFEILRAVAVKITALCDAVCFCLFAHLTILAVSVDGLTDELERISKNCLKELRRTTKCLKITSILAKIFFLIWIVGGGVQTGSTRHIDHSLAYCTCPGWLWGWRIWWNEWQGKSKYSPQIPLDQTRDWTRATAVGSQQQTASAMARPNTSVAWHISIMYCAVRLTAHCHT